MAWKPTPLFPSSQVEPTFHSRHHKFVNIVLSNSQKRQGELGAFWLCEKYFDDL